MSNRHDSSTAEHKGVRDAVREKGRPGVSLRKAMKQGTKDESGEDDTTTTDKDEASDTSNTAKRNDRGQPTTPTVAGSSQPKSRRVTASSSEGQSTHKKSLLERIKDRKKQSRTNTDPRSFQTNGVSMQMSQGGKKEEEYVIGTFDDIIKSLQVCISSTKKEEPVTIEQKFLDDKDKCQIHLIGVMGRYKETRRSIVSEKDTRYENLLGNDAHFTHTSQYDQKTSTSMRISKSHKIGIGAELGGSGCGASVTIGPSYEYSWGKDSTTTEDKGESKTSSVDITVSEGTAVVVKEVVYNVEKAGSSMFNLVLRMDEKIPYLCGENKQVITVKTQDLWNDHSRELIQKFNWRQSIGKDGNPVLTCPFVAACYCFTTERSMETIKQNSDLERTVRILDNYFPEENSEDTIEENSEDT